MGITVNLDLRVLVGLLVILVYQVSLDRGDLPGPRVLPVLQVSSPEI